MLGDLNKLALRAVRHCKINLHASATARSSSHPFSITYVTSLRSDRRNLRQRHSKQSIYYRHHDIVVTFSFHYVFACMAIVLFLIALP